MQSRILTMAILTDLALGLSGCGYSPGSRALSGGAIGGGVGGLGGALTSPSTINLGPAIVGHQGPRIR